MKGSRMKNGHEPDSDLTPAPSSDVIEEDTEDVDAGNSGTKGDAEDDGLPSPITPVPRGSVTPSRRVGASVNVY